MKLRQLVIAAFTLSSAVAFAHGNASKAMSDNSGDNSNISQVQQALNDKGFNPGPVDGKAGPKTKAALKQFQQSQGISASGKLDGQTLAALGVQSASPTQGSNDTQSSSQQSSDTSMSSSPTTSQSTSSIGSSQPPSSAPSDQQASKQQSGNAPSQSSTSKY